MMRLNMDSVVILSHTFLGQAKAWRTAISRKYCAWKNASTIGRIGVVTASR